MDAARLISERCKRIDTSAVVRMFELGARLKDPVNLAIGQPEFPVPDVVKDAACEAIRQDRNTYSVSQGILPLRQRLAAHLRADLGWDLDAERRSAKGAALMVNSGTSAALLTAMMAVSEPGDEVVIPDPYFGFYPFMVMAAGATPVYCDTYPDFRMTAERVERVLTPRTKAVLFNTPGNPTGVVATRGECADLLDLCRRRNVLLISDEIYAELTYGGAAEASGMCPSPGREPGASDSVLVVRGFGKSYAVTGWRLGYTTGPTPIIDAMERLQQMMYICPPTPLQWGVVPAVGMEVSREAARYERRAAYVHDRLSSLTRVERPQGSFYAFPEVPRSLGISAGQFFERCLGRNMLLMAGSIVSRRDTHVRLSFAVPDEMLQRGIDIVADVMSGK
jgi:aspartate/methionine/tyrosine aminotransferase